MPPRPTERFERAVAAIVRVGPGRGFVIVRKRDRLVVTAAHCLRRLPKAAESFSRRERTIPSLLGPPGGKRPAVWAECVFADPIADLAVLGRPSGQTHARRARDYSALTEVAPLRFRDARRKARCWLFGLDRHWIPCVVSPSGHGYAVEAEEDDAIADGMSGSPLLDAVGVLCCGAANGGGPNPRLARQLPRWLAGV